MAAIHDLLAQVQDEALRTRLEQEINRLSKQKKFGLVFEEHLPECTPLYDIPVKKGSIVAKKAGAVNEMYEVSSIKDGVAICYHRVTAEKEEIPVDELVCVSQFGEPIYPYLKPIDSVCNAPDSDLWHTLIEADNYHALQLLEYLYAGKVDCIYIDPPYNTGARDWKYNNDGIDLINCSDAVIKNSFIRSFDDSICIKGFTAFGDKNCERITVDNCVLWCGWGKTLEIGLATAAKNIKDITFSNCDLIRNQGICISIANGQFADISDVLYKNVNIEYEYVRKQIYQSSDDMVYEDGKLMLPRLLLITDARRTWQGNISADDERRSIRNVSFENINVICEKNITPLLTIHQANEYGEFDNIKIKTMHIHNKTLTNIDLLSHYDGEDLSLEITRNR